MTEEVLVPGVQRAFRAWNLHLKVTPKNFLQTAVKPFSPPEISIGLLPMIFSSHNPNIWHKGWCEALCLAGQRDNIEYHSDPTFLPDNAIPGVCTNPMGLERITTRFYGSNSLQARYYSKEDLERLGDKAPKIPSARCTCGFYARYDLNGVYDYIGHWNRQELVIGVIEAAGKVSLGTLGLRASKARIVALSVSWRGTATRRALERKFEVPVYASHVDMAKDFPPDPPVGLLQQRLTQGSMYASKDSSDVYRIFQDKKSDDQAG